ncbi:MAG: UDP-N-acetylmuramoyl-L-alanine--D-glutamate ligase [Bacteroidetes bacterium]|nr:UDP-N-acetylmuramoyl-L-alanine--D-glutamate ligase [Bacteroidota bacterium]
MLDLLRNELENKKVLLLGFGREGQSSYRLIRRILPDLPLTIADANETIREHELLKGDPFVKFSLGNNYLESLTGFDRILKSPGISLKNIQEEFSAGTITSQTDLFLRYYAPQVLGVTGTKGKSTTSTLIHHILKLSGRDALLLGNIGRPAFDLVDEINKDSIVVFELSSHQLEYLTRAPHIAVLLNLFEEHLDAYSSFIDYQLAKINIARYQSAGDYFIYNEDDERIRERIQEMKLHATALPFSGNHLLKNGCYREEDHLVFTSGGQTEKILDLKRKIRLKGEHNLLNIMAAVNVCKVIGVENEIIAEGVTSFRGLEHRIEYVGEYNRIHFYNDSIATIPEACMEAVKALGNVDTLILGGFDRGVDYSGLARFLSGTSVRNLIFTGDAGRRILHEIRDIKKPDQTPYLVSRFDDFLEIAMNVTNPGSICLLSPAAASYDEFLNFEMRGKRFKELVRGWKMEDGSQSSEVG